MCYQSVNLNRQQCEYYRYDFHTDGKVKCYKTVLILSQKLLVRLPIDYDSPPLQGDLGADSELGRSEVNHVPTAGNDKLIWNNVFIQR
mmetsp:Transcript_14835/g.31556  ORF Transcript_14835/g.31556 Transcript_14835/m.31556 type:complete len:88 (+) Transcript_14835:330-593(+)